MAAWFWAFFLYSLGGCGLEKLYARVTRAKKRTRKCLLFLPLCPVYGLGMTALLALPPPLREGWAAAVSGALSATAVEYGYHWACQTLLGVQFWDYSGVWGNLRGRVCLPFTLAWGALSAGALRLLQPWVAALSARISPEVTLLAVLVVTADAVCSARYLYLTGDPAHLGLRALRRA